ncbi:MAG: DMT family transporter [Burkholderiaceae bacterium]|nr:DMT family transporter [Burkholderiaceae bacterium]
MAEQRRLRSGPVSPLLPVLALLFNAFVWGVSWWPLRELESLGLHPLWATAFVYAFALLCVLAVRPGAWRAFAHQPGLWLLAMAAGLTNVGFNWAVTVGDVVRVVLLFYLMPAWTVLLAWPLLGEKPTAGSLARLALAMAGVAVVLKTSGSPWPVPESLADWLGLMGGLAFSLTNIMLRRLRDSSSQARATAIFGGGGLMAGATAAAGLAQGIVPAPPAFALAWGLLAMALALALIASNLCLQYGAARLSAQGTALVMLSEVIFASGSAIALGTAELTLRTAVGGALILAAAVWSAWPADPVQKAPD